MKIGTGISIVGIWIGVGIVGLHDIQGWTSLVAMFAFATTVFIAVIEKLIP